MWDFVQALLAFIISLSFNLMTFVVVFYFLFELLGPHFHHPIRHKLEQYTAPIIQPLHRIIPNYRNIDISLLILIFLLQLLKVSLLLLLDTYLPPIGLFFIWLIVLTANSFLSFYFLLFLSRIVITWILPIYANNSTIQLLFILTEARAETHS